MYHCSAMESRNMKGVPGVMVLLSKTSPCSVTSAMANPLLANSLRSFASSCSYARHGFSVSCRDGSVAALQKASLVV